MPSSSDRGAEPAVDGDEACSNASQATTEMMRFELTPNLPDAPFACGEPRSHDVCERVRQLRRLPAAHRDATGHTGKCGAHIKGVQPAIDGLQPRSCRRAKTR